MVPRLGPAPRWCTATLRATTGRPPRRSPNAGAFGRGALYRMWPLRATPVTAGGICGQAEPDPPSQPCATGTARAGLTPRRKGRHGESRDDFVTWCTGQFACEVQQVGTSAYGMRRGARFARTGGSAVTSSPGSRETRASEGKSRPAWQEAHGASALGRFELRWIGCSLGKGHELRRHGRSGIRSELGAEALDLKAQRCQWRAFS